MDLRCTAQRIGVLDLVGVPVVTPLEPGVPEQVTQLGGDGDLEKQCRPDAGWNRRSIGRFRRAHELAPADLPSRLCLAEAEAESDAAEAQRRQGR